MKLSPSEFDEAYRAQTLKLAFIGMSNIGKSFLSQRIEKEYNFQTIEVDSLIIKALGKDSMASFAQWQGQPYSDGYQERENQSTALETQATAAALSQASGNTLLDTPGSVIYIDTPVLEQLKTTCLIVYLRAKPTDLARLERDYYENPKPLIWNGEFQNHAGRSDAENIRDSYPRLLQARETAYARMADVTLEAEALFNTRVTTQMLFDAIRVGS